MSRWHSPRGPPPPPWAAPTRPPPRLSAPASPRLGGVSLRTPLLAARGGPALAQVRRYAAEQERQRQNERDFLRDASHLLRTPVTIARGFTELLRAGLTNPELMADADVILRELDSVNRIPYQLVLVTATHLCQRL